MSGGWPTDWASPGVAPHERPGGRPDWADVVEAAVRDRAGPGVDEVAGALVDWGCARLAGRALPGLVAVESVTARFGGQLRGWLDAIAARAATATATESAVSLCTTFPVLARLLAQTTQQAVTAATELLARFTADRAAVVAGLLGAADPGPLTGITARAGDPHLGGRSVSILEFTDGRRVVYRPRDVTVHVRFAELVEWFAGEVPGAAPRVPAVLARDGYGWLEFVEDRPPADPGRHAEGLGVLLALLHAVRAVDVHHENLLSDGDGPVLVDVETICHPAWPNARSADPASRALRSSVHRTGLLPHFVVDGTGLRDISAGGRGDLPDRTPALLAGFRRGYDAIMRGRARFAALVRGLADVEVRAVLRATTGYTGLLAATTRPDLLRDAAARDRALTDGLAGGMYGGDVVRHELADLWSGDIPFFRTTPGSSDVVAADGEVLPDVFAPPGLDDVLTTLAGMSDIDRRDQEWVIAAAIACLRTTSHDDPVPLPGPVAGTAADPQRLLTAACAVADRIVARCMTDRGRVNWLGLEHVDDRQWLVLPMGAGLANGYLGVALFLAQLGATSGIARYSEVGRAAIATMPALLTTLAENTAMVTAIGCGGLHGLGGIAFGLARIAVLQSDTEVRELAATAVDLAASAAAAPESAGWATGTAGCLAAMSAVHRDLGLPSAARLATLCADRLVAGPVPENPGFADGAAGVAWALRTCAPDHARTLPAAAPAAGSPSYGIGWCTGSAGRLLAGPPGETTSRALVGREPLGDMSLCHGEFGIAEAVVQTTAEDEPERRRYAALVLDAVERYGPRCGTPNGVPTPGLLTGLAGIGYGLLRLGFGATVPSALLLGTTTTGVGRARTHT